MKTGTGGDISWSYVNLADVNRHIGYSAKKVRDKLPKKKEKKKLILLGLFFQYYCEDHVHSSKYDSLHIFQFIIIQAAKVSLKGTAVAMEINFHINTCTIPGEAYMPMKRCEKKNKIKTKVFKVKNK